MGYHTNHPLYSSRVRYVRNDTDDDDGAEKRVCRDDVDRHEENAADRRTGAGNTNARLSWCYHRSYPCTAACGVYILEPYSLRRHIRRDDAATRLRAAGADHVGSFSLSQSGIDRIRYRASFVALSIVECR